MTSSAFWWWRTITIPPVTSPSPLSSATPRRISGPSATSATLPTRMGVPDASVPSAVARRDEGHDAGQGDVEGGEPVGVDGHLVLLDEASDRRHLGHPWDRLQPVAHVPVVERAQLGQVVLAGLIDQRVLECPA